MHGNARWRRIDGFGRNYSLFFGIAWDTHSDAQCHEGDESSALLLFFFYFRQVMLRGELKSIMRNGGRDVR